MKKEYSYMPKKTIILGGIFFGFCGVFLANTAMMNDRGLIINGIIHLGVSGATIFFWSLSIASFVFVAMSILGIYRRFAFPQRIIVSSESITVPKSSWSKEEVTIPIESVQNVSVTSVYGQRSATVIHSSGKFGISSSLLEKKEYFDEILNFLGSKLP
ncbi:hypothetical protein CH373_17705 [Leptospira perolatii]|uniref:DUF304 domain-containing protein n=1 Tax=Leptospira perolatii TaxID=2023191 RepID=A0A2M9ZI62_9LEPT|nr:hypothetical protein [Leptospira perolatii]PJZ68208.1 hypothetical protein CH360_17280 [Leptospira perolatii]PJZ71755.1 hypothetical protein CH373_17705 [Leptospira perolatii]